MMDVHLEVRPLEDWRPGLTRPVRIFGPCSAESEVQMLETARGIAARYPGCIFRAGVWKPRTRPGSFEGVGVVGLEWMRAVRDEVGLSTATEVAKAFHVEECLKWGIDVLWIGARTTVNPFAVQEIADALSGTDVPVFVKNPINPDLDLWVGALERVNARGVTSLGAIHRGFQVLDNPPFRNTPRWEIAVELKTRCPDLPVLCDVSHIAGTRRVIPYVAQRAIDLAMDGWMIETHVDPRSALSDAEQQVTPDQLETIIRSLTIKQRSVEEGQDRDELDDLRERIRAIDYAVLELLAKRMEISKAIGRYKQAHKVTVLQVDQWRKNVTQYTSRGEALGLARAFIEEFYDCIHEESIRTQTELLQGAGSEP